MSNKTIYVSQKDEALFDEAKNLAGEALSTVIAQALRDYVAKQKSHSTGMKEIVVHTGPQTARLEQRFYGKKVGKWQGFSANGEDWQTAVIYLTQKDNWAILLTTVCKASLLLDKKQWKANGEHLTHKESAELIVASSIAELENTLPLSLYFEVQATAEGKNQVSSFLDI